MIKCYIKKLHENEKVLLKVKVKVEQSKNLLTGILEDGTVKIDIANVPEKGRANQELISFLAKEFDVSIKNVMIISGLSSKNKLVKIIK